MLDNNTTSKGHNPDKKCDKNHQFMPKNTLCSHMCYFLAKFHSTMSEELRTPDFPLLYTNIKAKAHNPTKTDRSDKSLNLTSQVG